MSSPPAVHLSLLGTMAAATHSADGDRRLAKGKPVALLAFLALSPARRASRERLATLLWSEGSTEGARQNLRQTIWYLKRRLGEVIVADDDTVALTAGATTDVDHFLAQATTEHFTEAEAGYGGDFIPDFAAPGAAAFEDWAELERRRLRATYLSCAESAARASMTAGHAGDAVRTAHRARSLAPHDPAAWKLLLECLIAARDTLGIAAATAQLDTEISRDDLDPDPSLRALIRAARRIAGNEDVEMNGAEHADASLVPDLIGREAEFRTLVDSWEAARRGRGRAILITGAAGLGKTRLMSDFAARVSSTRGRTVQVRAHPGNRSIGSSLAAQLAESLASLPGAAAISPGSASVLVALSPLLASSFPGAEPDRATGEDALRRRASALGDLLTVLCESTPLALLVDDAHWADAESMRLVGALRARVENARSLLVIASRIPDELRQQMGSIEELALQPLDVAGVAEFVGRLASLPTEPWSRGFVPRLHEVSHGIPLLLIESLQRLVEREALLRRDGVWHAVSAEAIAAAMPPGSALQARLETLSVAERSALVRLATLGRPIAIDMLASDALVPDWLSVLGELERRIFLTRSEHRVSVWHDEIGRGILDLATPEDRLGAHGWVADLLVARAVTLADFKLAGWHAARAGDDLQLERTWRAALRFARERDDERSIAAIADDALPAQLGAAQRGALLRTTPMSQRLGRSARVWTAVVASLILGVGAWQLASAAQPPDAEIYFALDGDTSRALRMELSSGGEWSAGEPITAAMVPLRATPHLGLGFSSPGVPLPAGEGWLVMRAYADAGGQEIVLIDRSRRVRRVTNAPGDDFGGSPSPDGRFVAISTRRFDLVEHQAELLIQSLASDSVLRLTNTPEDEHTPLWSPDGTRLAFYRYFQTTDDLPQVCVMGVDGSGEHCAWEGLPPNAYPVAWSDASHLLVQVRGTRQAFRIDVATGLATHLGQPPGVLLPGGSGPYLICNCLDPASRRPVLMLARISDPLAFRPVSFESRMVDGRFVATSLRGGPAPYLDRIELEVSNPRIALDGAAAVQVAGFTNAGAETPVNAVRFTTRDTSVLTVRADGRIVPRALGRAWVLASAGGWRRDSIEVEVVPPTTEVVLEERWMNGWESRWRAFGQPRPQVVSLDTASALDPNGDGVYPSGIYLQRPLRTDLGLGIEFDIKVPVTTMKFQLIAVHFLATVASETPDSWDHSTGAGPMWQQPLCSTAFPSAEGGLGVREFAVSGSQSEPVLSPIAPPRDFYTERWHRVRLDYLPDGRCVLHVDGRLIASTEELAVVPGEVRLVVSGSSRGRRMLVGRVVVWRGVRAGS